MDLNEDTLCCKELVETVAGLYIACCSARSWKLNEAMDMQKELRESEEKSSRFTQKQAEADHLQEVCDMLKNDANFKTVCTELLELLLDRLRARVQSRIDTLTGHDINHKGKDLETTPASTLAEGTFFEACVECFHTRCNQDPQDIPTNVWSADDLRRIL
jgi:hypothetical protein